MTLDEDAFVRVPIGASDPDGDPLTYAIMAAPRNGRSTIQTIGGVAHLTYLPDPNYFGTDSVTYTISDGTQTVTRTAAVTVRAVNDPAYAASMPFTTLEDTPL